MTRKSPYHHPVKAHERAGVQVSDYERGKGSKPKVRTHVKPSRGRGAPYRITVYHGDGSETYEVDAGNYTTALIGGLSQAQGAGAPTHVRIRGPRRIK